MKIEELENKYIKLLLNRCINFNKCKALYIECDHESMLPFAEKLKKEANKMGILDVYIAYFDQKKLRDYLIKTDIDDIVLNPLIDHSKRNEYAMRGAGMLFPVAYCPGSMDGVSLEKNAKYHQLVLQTTLYYSMNVIKYVFPWCIFSLPNKEWAELLFGKSDDSYEKLYRYIFDMCMINENDPILNWEKYIKTNNYYKEILNSLEISKLHYTNSLGTDLYLELPKNSKWLNLCKQECIGGMMISNIPSYEIFTSPDYRKTEGIVYGSKPLIYDNIEIQDLKLEFKNGKVVNYDAKKEKGLLKNIIESNDRSAYLGECALVPYDSPISNTGIVFYQTLFDENASCHFALGKGFPTIFNDENLTNEELLARGVNITSTHVDFMIGTKDLNIEADTNKGKVLIFKDGNFNL